MDVVLAHPGGHLAATQTSKSLVVIAVIGLSVVCGLVLARRLELSAPRVLVVPLLSVAMVAALSASLLRTTVVGWFPWAVPMGIGLLAGLLVVSATKWELTSWPVVGGVGALVFLGVMFVTPLLTPTSPWVEPAISGATARLVDGVRAAGGPISAGAMIRRRRVEPITASCGHR